MTSNIGSSDILGFEGSTDADAYESMKAEVTRQLKQAFRPEFLNRVDEVVVFHALDREQLVSIVDIQLRRLERRLADKNIPFELSEGARRWLAEAGYDPVYGARPIKRTIQKSLESEIARRVLAGVVVEGQTLLVDVDDGKLTFASEPAPLELPERIVTAE